MARKDRQAAPRAKNIYLTGFMCAGKTSAGRALSRALGLPFRDSDELIEKEAGRTVAELVRSKGLARFRSLEAAQVRKLASSGGRVIALGGGVYPSGRWKGLLEATGVSVFLFCPWPELRARLRRASGPRPLLSGPPGRALARARSLYAKRLPFYRQADVTVDAAGLAPAEAAARIKKALARNRFVLLRAPGRSEAAENLEPPLLKEVFLGALE